MVYLTYEEYSNIGGTLDIAAFNRNLDRACGVIDNATYNRMCKMDSVPTQAKAACRDLIEYLYNNDSISEKGVLSHSESQGPISESVSYVTKTPNDIYGDIQNILFDYLGSVIDDYGTPLLYRGCLR